MSDAPIYHETCAALLVDDPLALDVPAPPATAPTAGRHHFRPAGGRRLLPGEPALAGLHDPFPPRPDERTAMPAEPGQDDLTEFDHDITDTDKLSPADLGLPQPPQDPDWRPPGAQA